MTSVATKGSKSSPSVRARLNKLSCPYVEDLDEDAVNDLVLTPGEGRIRILQWLMTSFNPKVFDFLDSGQGAIGSRADSRLQKLLTVARAMLLCSADDIALIKGDAPVPQQLIFWHKLLDLCSQKLLTQSHLRPSTSTFTDALASTGFISQLSSNWKPDLLPKDIRSELSRQQDGEKTRLPSLKSLMEQSELISVEIDKYTKELEKLQKVISVPSRDQSSELTTMSQMLSTLVRELGQLVGGFTHCFEARLGLWCQKSPPELSELGPTLGRVHAQLDDFIKVFEDLNSIRALQTKLQKEKPNQEMKQDISQSSLKGQENFQKCLSVLEESLHRHESNFVSKYQALLADSNLSV